MRTDVTFYANIDGMTTKPAKEYGEDPDNKIVISGKLDGQSRAFLAELMRHPYVVITIKATQGALGE